MRLLKRVPMCLLMARRLPLSPHVAVVADVAVDAALLMVPERHRATHPMGLLQIGRLRIGRSVPTCANRVHPVERVTTGESGATAVIGANARTVVSGAIAVRARIAVNVKTAANAVIGMSAKIAMTAVAGAIVAKEMSEVTVAKRGSRTGPGTKRLLQASGLKGDSVARVVGVRVATTAVVTRVTTVRPITA